MEIQTILSLGIIFLATLLQGTFGFGSALVAVPLLSLVVGIKVAVPISAFLGVTIGIFVILTNWKKIEFSSIWRLFLLTPLGIFSGVFLLKIAPQGLILRFLGLFLIGFALYRLARIQLPYIEQKWAYGFGFLAGILGGAYNTAGPPIVIYGTMRRWHPLQFRATLQGYFFMTAVVIFTSHGINGLWTKEIFRLYGLSLPGIAIATGLGGQINRHLPVQRFEQLLYFILIGLGVLLWL